MFQSSTVRPHPHCFCPAHIPWAISPRLRNRVSAFRGPSSKCLDLLARLAQDLSAWRCHEGYHFRTRQVLILSTFPRLRPLLSLSTALIITFSFRYFGLFGELILTLARPPSGFDTAPWFVSGFHCPNQDRTCALTLSHLTVPRDAHSCTPDWTAAALALPTFLSISGTTKC